MTKFLLNSSRDISPRYKAVQVRIYISTESHTGGIELFDLTRERKPNSYCVVVITKQNKTIV